MDLFEAKGAVEVAEPQLYKGTFPYDDFPKNSFIEGTYPYDVPEEIWVTDTTFRDGSSPWNPLRQNRLKIFLPICT